MKFNRGRKHSVRFTPKTDINSDSSNFIAQEKTKRCMGREEKHELGGYKDP